MRRRDDGSDLLDKLFIKIMFDIQLFALTYLFFSASPSIPLTPYFIVK